MGRGGMLRVSVPILKKHMEERGKAVTLGESAELLGMSSSAALGVLDYVAGAAGAGAAGGGVAGLAASVAESTAPCTASLAFS